VLRRALEQDLPRTVEALADGQLGPRSRRPAEARVQPYVRASHATADPAQLLVEALDGQHVRAHQATVLHPGLARRGALGHGSMPSGCSVTVFEPALRVGVDVAAVRSRPLAVAPRKPSVWLTLMSRLVSRTAFQEPVPRS